MHGGTTASRVGTDPLQELRETVALELLPGRKRMRVGPVDEQHPVEMIDLVLEGTCRKPLRDDLVPHAISIEKLHEDLGVPVDVAPQSRHGQTPLVYQELLIRQRLDLRVDDHCQ